MSATVGFVEMTKSCARDLTDRIKAAGEEFAALLYRAHEERAWQALGYDSWKAYCRAEFQLSRPRSYQLLDFVEIKHELEMSTLVDAPQTERQTRALKAVPAEKRVEVWEVATERSNGQQPTAIEVEQAVNEIKYPIEARPIPEAAIRAREEAAKDTEGLWTLKSAWRKATSKDKKAFKQWEWDRLAAIVAHSEEQNDQAPSEGMRLVEQAISILSRIAPNDTQRRRAIREFECWSSFHFHT